MSQLVTFKIDKDFVKNNIEPLLSPEFGYTSMAEIIRDAIRDLKKKKMEGQ